MEPESTEEASTTTTTKQETSSESDAQRQLDPQTNETSREPVKTPSDDDDDDKTEPASDDFAKDCSSFESAEKNTENRSPDVNEENAREPTDLSLKNKQQEVAVSSKEEEEDRNVRSFRLDSNETTAKLHVDHRQKVHEGSLLRPTDRKPVQGTGNSIDFAALGIILNNNNIEQAIIHQLLNSRNVAMGNGDQLQAKKKRVRSRKRRSDATGSPGTGSASGPAEIAGSGSGLLPDSSSSPPVVLDVVCGQNQASLCLDKLRSGSKTACVLLNGTWLTPNQYQHVSGRGTARDWKRSIKHNGTSLKALLASKVLTFDPPQCRCNLCVAVTTYSKENAKLAGSSADQENQPPRGVDCTSAGNGKSTSGLRIPMEVLPTTGAVVRESSDDNATKEAVDEDDDDDEDEDDEEEEGQEEEEEEEESMADENEVDAEEEEDWTRKRALMQALALMELPSATPAAAAEAAASDQVSRKRKSVQSDVRAIKKKKSDKVSSSSSSPAEAAGGGGGGSGGRTEAQGGGGASGAASSSKSLETTDPVASVSPSVGLGLSLTLPSSAVLANASSADSAKSTQSRITQSFQKEETLTHIIHELRNYKKSLEEKIVAGRRCSSSQDAKDSNNSSVSRAIHQNKNTTNNSASRANNNNNNNNNWSTPTSTTGHQRRTDDCGRTTEGRKADWPALKSSATRTEGPDEKQQLPDLVRSHNPSTVTATSSRGGGGGGLSALTPKTYSLYATHPLSPACLSSTCHYGPQARYVVDPQNGTKYECDEFGAVDLRVGKKTAGASLPFYVACSRVMGKMNVDCCGGGDSDGERVLDLSVSSKVKVDVKLATTEERVPKRKRLSDGHSRRAVKKQTWPASAGKMLAWSVVDVVKFINEVPGCTAYAETFKQFGVTGASLVCLSIDQMTAILRMRFDAAQALRSAIDRLLNAPPREQGGGGGGGGAATAAVAAVAAAAAAAASRR